MNVKLLTELVEKADKDFALALVPADTLEKFAELIVTKCAVIATRCESNGTKNIGAEILEHFGVE